MALDEPERDAMDAAWKHYQRIRRNFRIGFGAAMYGVVCAIPIDRYEAMREIGVGVLILLKPWGGVVLCIYALIALFERYPKLRDARRDSSRATKEWAEAHRRIPPP